MPCIKYLYLIPAFLKPITASTLKFPGDVIISKAPISLKSFKPGVVETI
jgi:hypothetical protein